MCGSGKMRKNGLGAHPKAGWGVTFESFNIKYRTGSFLSFDYLKIVYQLQQKPKDICLLKQNSWDDLFVVRLGETTFFLSPTVLMESTCRKTDDESSNHR